MHEEVVDVIATKYWRVVTTQHLGEIIHNSGRRVGNELLLGGKYAQREYRGHVDVHVVSQYKVVRA